MSFRPSVVWRIEEITDLGGEDRAAPKLTRGQLEHENARLRSHLEEVQDILDRAAVSDRQMPRLKRLKNLAHREAIVIVTRTLPRVAVIALIAYVVHLVTR